MSVTKPGLFIAIEGLDGCGKSTQLALLKQRLDAGTLPYKAVHFPRYESEPFGGLIAAFLKGKLGEMKQVHPYLASLLFALDRNDAKDGLREALDGGTILVTDRYLLSNAAFQAAKLNDPDAKRTMLAWLLDLELRYFAIPEPTVSIFLDMPPSFTAQRLKERQSKDAPEDRDIHEGNMSFQRRVREEYLQLFMDKKGHHIVACGKGQEIRTPQDIHEEIAGIIRREGVAV